MKTIVEELEALANRFSEGWHDGIKIDANDVMLLCNAAAELRVREETKVPEDFFTHQQAWRDAIEMASKRTKTLDDKDYWLHELKAFDAAYESLKPSVKDCHPKHLEAYTKELEHELSYWKQRAATMHEHQQGECWYWQGDGHDHPESMVDSLPVVIRADALRSLMNEALPNEQPIGFMSPKQISLITDPYDESGIYIPLRKTALGNFTLALYSKPQKDIRVWGWVWKDKRAEDECCYVPSYTPEEPYRRGELFALVDPMDLHRPLENTDWYGFARWIRRQEDETFCKDILKAL